MIPTASILTPHKYITTKVVAFIVNFLYNVKAGGDFMNIDLNKLINDIEDNIVVDDVISFDQAMLEGTDLIELKNISLVGSVYKGMLDEIRLSLTITGNMVLPCAVTLKPVDYPFSKVIDVDVYETLVEIDENYQKIDNSIDILPIIWENIVVEIPLRVVSSDAYDSKLEGQGWKLVTEDEDDINPELAKLKDLL